MAKQKKKRKANPNSRPKPKTIQLTVALSQCMIVKNEEKNIERALSWGKDIVSERIVVDTGSTDRTVEIAESMGAKVYHFDWVDDFSAAKNFAIEQASGNWIAFLDADEYMLPEDAKAMLQTLLKAEHPEIRDKCHAIRCTFVELGDNDAVLAVHEHDRFFRNLPHMRYQGRIHERLVHQEGNVAKVPELKIFHTGYAKTAYAEGNKATRNLELLRAELVDRPDDPNLMAYLADSLRIEPTDENKMEAERLYRAALDSPLPMFPQLRQVAYNYIIAKNINISGVSMELCQRAVSEFPENPDFLFYYGLMMNNQSNHYAAWDYFSKCEALLKTSAIEQSNFVLTNPKFLFFEMVKASAALDKTHDTVRCATLLLKEDKYQDGIIRPYIGALKAPDSGTTDADVLSILGQLYDLTSPKDKIYLMRAAKDAGELGLTRDIYNLLTPEELEWLSGGDGGEDA